MTGVESFGVVVLALAAVADHRSLRIPNSLTLGGLAVVFFTCETSWALLWALAGFSVALPGVLRGRLGGGDAKLAALASGALGGFGFLAVVLALFVLPRLLPPRIERAWAPVLLLSTTVVLGVRSALR